MLGWLEQKHDGGNPENDPKWPSHIYKYRCWDDKHDEHKRWLSSPEIYFANPIDFNDPFDCTVKYDWSLIRDEYLRSRIEDVLKQQRPGIDTDELQSKVDYRMTQKEKLKPVTRKTRVEQVEDIGICSFGGVPDSILMWSHYASSHSGICIEYDVRALMSHIFERYEEDNDILIDLYGVRYEKDYPRRSPEHLSDKDYTATFLTRKFADWSYEQEYRLVWDGRSKRPLSISRAAISKIYLGCEMDDSAVRDVVNTVKSFGLKAQVLKASRRSLSFSLDFDPISS